MVVLAPWLFRFIILPFKSCKKTCDSLDRLKFWLTKSIQPFFAWMIWIWVTFISQLCLGTFFLKSPWVHLLCALAALSLFHLPYSHLFIVETKELLAQHGSVVQRKNMLTPYCTREWWNAYFSLKSSGSACESLELSYNLSRQTE